MLSPEVEGISPNDSAAFVSALHGLSGTLSDGGGQPLQREVVRASLRAVCVLARQIHIPPERLVIALKEMMTGAVVQGIPIEQRDEARGEVVGFAINEYFSNAR